MPQLTRVEAWPPTRHADRPWHADTDVAAFLGVSRGVFDLYRDELPPADLTSRASFIRFFIADRKRRDGLEVAVQERFHEGFEMAHISLPESFGTLDRGTQTWAALDVIHAGVCALAELRGWDRDRDRLDAVRQRVLARGLRFTWASPWKASPSGRHQARALYWLDQDGNGRVQLEIRRSHDGDVVARSGTALAFMTAEGFKRSAATLRWQSGDTVTVVPWSGLFGDVDGLLQLDLGAGMAASATPEPVPPVGGPVPMVIATTASEPPHEPTTWLVLQRVDVSGLGAYSGEIRRVADLLARDEEYSAWWAGTPFRTLLLRVSVPDPGWPEASPKPGVRKAGEDLTLTVVIARSELPGKGEQDALRARARADLYTALVATAQSRRLAPPPPLPARVGMNSREWRSATGH